MKRKKTPEEKANEFAVANEEYPSFKNELETVKANCFLAGYKDCQKEYEEKLRWIPIEEKVPEIKKDTYQVLIERQDGLLDLIFIHKTMLDYEVKEILIDWHKAVRWRYIFL